MSILGVGRRIPYEDVVLSTKPGLYVPFQGSAPYEIMKSNALTSNSGTPLPFTGPFPGAGSWFFDGTNDRLQHVTNTAYHPGDTLSIAGWFNRTGTGSDGSGAIIVDLGNTDLTVFFSPTDKLSIRKRGTGDIFVTTGSYAAPTGWKHFVGRKTAGTAADIFVDGVSVAGTYTNQTLTATTNAVSWGLLQSATTFDYQGAIAHWAIWDRVITVGEIKMLYEAGRNNT